jgi:AcrR family transcriptional regulator
LTRRSNYLPCDLLPGFEVSLKASEQQSSLHWDMRASVDERRDQILRSLASFVRERKLSSLTMRDIADRLGLVKGNLYYYFKSKQDILYHCHVKCIAISLAALDEVRAQKLPPAQALRELLIKHILNITEDPYGGVLLTDLESLSTVQRRRYVAMRDQFEHAVRKMICDGIEDGSFVKQNVHLAGFTILGAINWIPKWHRPDGPLPSATIAEAIADQLLRSLRP